MEISLATIGATIDFDRDNVDIAIQAGPGSQPDTVSYELLEMNIVPICNPNMVNGRPPPTDISELSEFMLLHALRPIDPQHDLWNCWAKGAQFKSLHKASRSYFPTFDMVYSAASEGLGIGIGAKCFLDEELSKGKLIIPFDLTVLFPVPYYLVIPKDKLDIPHIKVFRDWILKEAGKPIH